MSQVYRYPTSTFSLSAVGTNGATAPSTSIQIAGEDISGNLQPLMVDASGALEVSVINFNPSSPMPIDFEQIAGAAPSATNSIPIQITDGTSFVDPANAANQVTANTSLATALTRLSGSLVPDAFDEVDLTYVPSGAGVGQVATAVYKLASATVKTLTMSYDGSDRLSSVVAS